MVRECHLLTACCRRSRRISKRFFVYSFLFAVAFTATMTDLVSLRVLTCALP